MENQNVSVINLRELFNCIWARRKLFAKVVSVVFVLSCLYIVCIPRSYTTTCKLAPEINGNVNSGSLGALASSFGIDVSQVETADAITPRLYPDLMEDNKFVVSLFPVIVKKLDGSVETTYSDYLMHYQKTAWWTWPLFWAKSLLQGKDDAGVGASGLEHDPYILSKDYDDLAKAIRTNVQLSINKKTGVITIQVEDQDQLICKTLADSVSVHLQQFITEYRTNKARTDLEFYRKLTKDAKAEYDSVRRKYNAFADANLNVVLHRVKSQMDDMENEMVLKFQTYSNLTAMYQQSLAKVQERTPVFTVLKGAEMPLKAAKPKRMIFVIGMCILATFVLSLYIVRKEIHFLF